MKTIKHLLIIMALLFAIPFCGAQNVEVETETEYEKDFKVRSYRVGAKVGFPNLIGGNLEYLTPLFKNKLAVNLDFSMMKSNWLELGDQEETDAAENDELDFTYIEGGLNYYFFKPGRGLYGGVSYGNIKIKGIVYYQDSRDIIDSSHGSMNIKLGAKLGGLIYFRPEVGYSFSPLPNTVEATKIYNDGSRETVGAEFDSEGTSYDLLFSGLMANIGLGFAF